MRCGGLSFPTVGFCGGSWFNIYISYEYLSFNTDISWIHMDFWHFVKCLLFSIIYNITVFNRLVEQVRTPRFSSHICHPWNSKSEFHGTALYSGLLKNISIDHNEWNCWMNEGQTGWSLAYKDTVHHCSRVLLFPSSYSPVPNAFYFMHLQLHVNTKYPEHCTLNEQWWPDSTVAINKNYSKFQTKRWELSGEKRNICKTGTKSERRPVGNVYQYQRADKSRALSCKLFFVVCLLCVWGTIRNTHNGIEIWPRCWHGQLRWFWCGF